VRGDIEGRCGSFMSGEGELGWGGGERVGEEGGGREFSHVVVEDETGFEGDLRY